MGQITEFTRNSGDALWTMPINFLIIIATSLFMLQGYEQVNQGNVEAGLAIFIPGALFFMMYVFSYVLIILAEQGSEGQQRFLDTGYADIESISILMVLGFVLWYIVLFLQNIGTFGYSIIPEIPTNVLLSVAEPNVPDHIYYFTTGIAAPIVEEKFFGAALPVLLLGILDLAGIDNKFGRMLAIVLIPGALFASFHVGHPTFSAFWWSALAFSVIVRGLVMTDFNYEIIPTLAIFFSFMYGAHIANNIFHLGGLIHFLQVLSGSLILFTVVVSVALFYTYFAVISIVEKLSD